jgi:hypothetical protein
LGFPSLSHATRTTSPKSHSENHRALNPMIRRYHPFSLLGLLIFFFARVPIVHSQQMHPVDPQINQNIDSLLARTIRCINIMQQTVENENWDIGGGTSTLLELQINNKTILVANAPFATNMKIHDLLNSVDTISNLPASRDGTANPAYSQRALQQPGRRAPRSSRQRH